MQTKTKKHAKLPSLQIVNETDEDRQITGKSVLPISSVVIRYLDVISALAVIFYSMHAG